jgi:hypothetical protein
MRQNCWLNLNIYSNSFFLLWAGGSLWDSVAKDCIWSDSVTRMQWPVWSYAESEQQRRSQTHVFSLQVQAGFCSTCKLATASTQNPSLPFSWARRLSLRWAIALSECRVKLWLVRSWTWSSRVKSWGGHGPLLLLDIDHNWTNATRTPSLMKKRESEGRSFPNAVTDTSVLRSEGTPWERVPALPVPCKASTS